MGSLIEGKRDLTGQIYMRNRYYDPASGRFTQEDPLGLAGGLNLYAFAKGDPVNFSDPFGLCPYAGLKRTISLADCPKDERLDAFKVMEKTKMGRYFIQQFTIGRLNLELHAGTVQCGSHANANGCSNHLQGTMVINSSQSASAIASAVVHETMHWIVWGASAFVQNHITIGSFVGDEMPAYAAGWTFYNGLPQGLRNDAGLNYIAGMYRTDPATAMRMQCLWSVYDGCGDW